MKKMRKTMVLVFLFLLMLGIAPVTVHAGSVKELESGKTYTSYDFTGDGKSDKFKYVINRSGPGAVARTYVNGRYRGTINLIRGGSLYRCGVSKTNVFLISYCGQFGGNMCEAYRYSGGKFVKIRRLTDTLLSYNRPYKVSGSTLYTKSSTGKDFGGTFDYRYSRGASFLFRHTVKSGRISAPSQTGTVVGNKIYTAGKSFYTSTGTSSMNGKGPYVSKGRKVVLKSACRKSNGMWFLISVNGKNGWIKDSSRYLLK